MREHEEGTWRSTLQLFLPRWNFLEFQPSFQWELCSWQTFES